MLFLTRKIGQSIVINDDIELRVIDVNGRTVKLGFEFPPTARVLRRELYEKIQTENKRAADQVVEVKEALSDLLNLASDKKRAS